MDPLEGLVDTIAVESSKTKEEIFKLIRQKQDELSGLVSKEGAAYIVGRELGVSLIKETRPLHKIANVTPGIFSVDVKGRVLNIMDPREFDKNGRQGKVQNIVIGDDSGSIRLTLWNQELDLVKRLGIKDGVVLEVRGGYTKQDFQGNPELRIGKGLLKIGTEDGLSNASAIGSKPVSTRSLAHSVLRRRGIEGLKEGDVAEIRAMLIQLFQRRPFYEICPTCGKRVSEQSGSWECKEHGKVEPAYSMVISGFIDDGESNMRAVFFRDAAEKVMGKTVDHLKALFDEKKSPEALFDGLEAVGNEFIFRGRVSKNSLTNNMELTVNEIEPIDPRKETEALL